MDVNETTNIVRKLDRERRMERLADGLVEQRSCRIESGKRYKRRKKHRKADDD